MAVPKERKSRSKRDMRRAHHDRMTLPNTVPCAHCGDPKLPHRVCANCGHLGKRLRRGQLGAPRQVFVPPEPEVKK